MSTHSKVSTRGSRAPPPSSLATRIETAGFDWIVPDWPAAPGVHSFVTTRNGGVSVGTAASLDLGGASPGSARSDETRAVAENRRRVEAFLPATPSWLRQVHGADVIVVDARNAHPGLLQEDVMRASGTAPNRHPPQADAAVTRDTDVVLAVRVADCLPVLFADRAGSVIGIAHAGWRGLAAGVLENTLSAMHCDPAQILAWLGPAIGRSAFEVGVDVHDAFVQADIRAKSAFVAARPGKWYADLEALARMRLEGAGVSSIDGAGMCTVCDPARFFSFRRDRATGRMAAFLWLEGPHP